MATATDPTIKAETTSTWKPANWDSLGVNGQVSWLQGNKDSLKPSAVDVANTINSTPGLMDAISSQNTATTPATQTTSDLINQQSQQALAAKIAAAQKARDEAVNGYNQQADALPGQYQPLRNQASLQGAQNSRAITEDMAAQGNWRSGANQSEQGRNTATTSNAISGYNMQQQQAVDELKQAIAQTQANYGYDVAGATAETEAQKLAAQIAQANTDKSFNMQQQQMDNQTSQFAQTFGLSQQQFAQQITQQGIDNAYRDAAFAQQADRFAQQMNLSRDQFKAQLDQWAKQYKLDEASLYGYSGGSYSSGGSSSSGTKRGATTTDGGTTTFNRSTTTPDGKTTYY